MDTGVLVALIASATSLIVSLGAALIQRHADREEREEQRRSDVKRVLDQYRGPLLVAASDLGHRIDNIRHGGFLSYLDSTDRGTDARHTTLFRFAQYFGWREILRTEVQLLRFGRDDDTRLVAA